MPEPTKTTCLPCGRPVTYDPSLVFDEDESPDDYGYLSRVCVWNGDWEDGIICGHCKRRGYNRLRGT